MERLTERWCAGGIRIKGCSTLYQDVERKSAPMASAIARLAAYEDTGLSPETVNDLVERFSYFYRTVEGLDIVDPVHFGAFVDRVKHWAQAEKDGRLVVLPCKVGDRVYRVITARDAAPVMTEIEIKTFGQAADLIGRIGEKQLRVSWYLTREEADAALKKREEADNEANP